MNDRNHLARSAPDEPRTVSSPPLPPPGVEHAVTVQGCDGPALGRLLRERLAALGGHETGRLVFAGRDWDRGLLADSSGNGLVCYQEGPGGNRQAVAVQAFAMHGARPEPVEFQGRRIGCVHEDDHARYCRLAAVVPTDRSASRQDQTREVLKASESALRKHGFDFRDTIRTWFYLERLLEWYGEFNAVRTAFFTKRGVFERVVPASTGIDAANDRGTALCCGLLAVRPKTGSLRIRSVESPMQGPALRYRSSFSRAVELEYPGFRHLLVSGTASIDPDGRTVHAGDCLGQIRLTMRVLEVLLASRGMDWGDLRRGIAYVKDLADLPLFTRTCRDLGVPDFPLATVQAGICRDDLLFEIEADALRRTDQA